LNVTVVWATPHLQDVVAVELSPGATVADAARCSGFIAQYGLDPATVGFARFGVRTAADARLAEGDRVEITRELPADPAAARARRARAEPPAAGASRARRDPAK
jgi:putative ubiquitin-RnfH superfamily antitoxin RatB of RatAB toxin-antitoxin module